MTWLTRRLVWTPATIAFVVGVVAFLPAHLFEDRINQALTPPWHLSVSGTVWDGFGVLQSAQSSDAVAVPLTWKFDPLALARLRIGWTIVPTSPSLSGTVKVGAGWQSVEFRDAALTMDAGTLQQAIPLIAIFAPSGNLSLSTPSASGLTIRYGNLLRVTGDANIKADNVGLRPYGPQPLGNYQLKVTGHDTAIDYVVTQSSGALKLEGGGSIRTTPPRQLAYSGHITPSPMLPDNLLTQLKSIGQAGADGRLRVDWKAQW